jgi:hypothetical protein
MPRVPAGTTNTPTPFPILAETSTMSAIGAPSTSFFAPDRINPLADFFASVSIA